MKILRYYLTGNYENALEEVFETIPCLICRESDGSTTITCREADNYDVLFIELRLAKFIK